MTQLEAALKGTITPEMRAVAAEEHVSLDTLAGEIAAGRIIILKNTGHNVRPIGIGKGLSTKVNANIGTSPERMDMKLELSKLQAAVKYGADTVMDLSLGAVLNEMRRKILAESPVPVGTVPMYQAGFEISRQKRDITTLTIDDYLAVLRRQAEEGVDFVTVHAGLTRRAWEMVKDKSRIMDVVSRGGSMLCVWMEKNNAENPLYTHFDRVLEICREFDVAMSLGDGLRPGATRDATDRAQIEELITLGVLARRCREAGVQVMIEGPGHVPLDQVVANIQVQKRLCDDAPFYILGPLVTDVAPGYDHITGAIGGALAASAGADYLCYVTPAEHLCLPDENDVREGVIASKIAAHAADMVKYPARARRRDDDMSRARKALNWETMYRLALDPDKARQRREESGISDKDYCSMCGDFCSVRSLNSLFDESVNKQK